MGAAAVRILVVDDFEPWRRFVISELQKRPEWHMIGEVGDGGEAVLKSKELQPDLILLDLNLPTLNGIEVIRQVREFSPNSAIILVSETRSAEIAEEIFRRGARGYVVKSSGASELLNAIEVVLQGKQFVSARLDGLRLH